MSESDHEKTGFREAFIAAYERSGMTIPEIAQGAGVSKDILNKLKQRRVSAPNVMDAIKIAHFFGMSIEAFIGLTERPVDDELSERQLRRRFEEENEGFVEENKRLRAENEHLWGLCAIYRHRGGSN